MIAFSPILGQFIIAVGLPYHRAGQKSEIINLLNPDAKYELLPDIFPPRYGAIGGIIQNQTFIAGGFDYPNYLQDYFVDIRQHRLIRGVIIQSCSAGAKNYQNNQFYKVKIEFSKFCFSDTTIFNILDNTTEL